MEFFVGLDVSLDETHICVVDEGGRIVKETRAASEPKAIAKAIRHKGRRALNMLAWKPATSLNGSMRGLSARGSPSR